MSSKKKFWLIFGGVSVLLAVLILGAYVWMWNRMDLILEGHVKPIFPFNRYSAEELGQMYPQYRVVSVKTVRTPEETHKLLIEKMKAGDLDGAVECCVVKERWEEIKQALLRIKASGRLEEMIKDYDTKLEPNLILDNTATYEYGVMIDGVLTSQMFSFVKKPDGIWLLESL